MIHVNGGMRGSVALGVDKLFYRLPEGTQSTDLPFILRCWFVVRPWLLILLSILPFAIYRKQLDTLQEAWFAPLMAIFACALPSSGAPVAGGVIFLPFLSLAGLCARDIIGFTALTQAVGVGVFSPLNWMILDQGILALSALSVASLPSCLGMFVALVVFPISSVHGDHIVLFFFASFCVILSYYVIRGMMHDSISFDKAPRGLQFSVTQIAYYGLALFLASIMTGYIGVAVDKMLFILLTWSHGVHVRDATVTGTTLVGWLSAFAAYLHVISPCDPNDENYIGAVPYHFFFASLPGLLLGSLLGPYVSIAIGSRNVMKIFLVVLVVDLLKTFYHLYYNWGDVLGACTPQCPERKDMQLFLEFQH